MGDGGGAGWDPRLTPRTGEAAHEALQHEILSEKAASLGRAERRMAQALALLAGGPANGDREPALKAAADAVHAYFIQRELCGWRRHDDIVRDHDIPRQVLARLGAR
jgi:hypothetical protein